MKPWTPKREGTSTASHMEASIDYRARFEPVWAPSCTEQDFPLTNEVTLDPRPMGTIHPSPVYRSSTGSGPNDAYRRRTCPGNGAWDPDAGAGVPLTRVGIREEEIRAEGQDALNVDF